MPRLMRLCDLLDPKHLGESCSRRHGQVSPDVTHVAVEKLISKGGHPTIVSTHPGCGQDNRDILMLVGNCSARIVERPYALFKIRVEGHLRLATRPHQHARLCCQGPGARIL